MKFTDSFDSSSSFSPLVPAFIDLSEEIPETPQVSAITRESDLSYKQRCQIHALKFLAEWTYSQIADTIEIPLTTV